MLIPPPAYELDQKLLALFELPVPGVKLSEVFVPGYPADKIEHVLRNLIHEGLIEARRARDADGRKFSGRILSITELGGRVLDGMRCRSGAVVRLDLVERKIEAIRAVA